MHFNLDWYPIAFLFGSDALSMACVASNLSSLGGALFETGIAWFWNDKRINKIFTVMGCDNFNDVYDKNNDVLIIGIHSMSMELEGRVMGLCFPVNAMY
ncbi:hypothetical protein ABM014_18975 [Morganella morganii]